MRANEERIKSIDLFFLLIIAFFLVLQETVSNCTSVLKFITGTFVSDIYYTSDNILPSNDKIKVIKEEDGSYIAKYKGIIPLEEVEVINVDRPRVIVGDDGIYFEGLSKNATVVGFAENSPAKEAGLEINDIILDINGIEVIRNYDVSNICKEDADGVISIKAERDGEILEKELRLTEDKKMGVVISYVHSLIGTLSFIFGENNEYFYAVGHDLGDLDVIGSTVVQVATKINEDKDGLDVTDIVSDEYGAVLYADDRGVVGLAGDDWKLREYADIAWSWEIDTSKPVEVLMLTEQGKTTVSCKIENTIGRLIDENEMEKNLYRYTLKLDGDAIMTNGMSGSPILQNGKFIGVMSAGNISNRGIGYMLPFDEIYTLLNECKDTLNLYSE